jgi:hypothetical protein
LENLGLWRAVFKVRSKVCHVNDYLEDSTTV